MSASTIVHVHFVLDTLPAKFSRLTNSEGKEQIMLNIIALGIFPAITFVIILFCSYLLWVFRRLYRQSLPRSEDRVVATEAIFFLIGAELFFIFLLEVGLIIGLRAAALIPQAFTGNIQSWATIGNLLLIIVVLLCVLLAGIIELRRGILRRLRHDDTRR